MYSEFIITIHDVLKRPLFRKARVIAGANGLHRRVRWVHILEISSFETLIHGEEMILSTGIGFRSDMTSPTSFLKKLIQQNVSCLCLEIGPYFDSVPEEMIEIANRHDFPLIIFPETVRFIDITQDIHSLIINRHHKMLQDLERISREFRRATLTTQGTSTILKLLHKNTNAQVIYVPIQGQPSFIPSMNVHEQNEFLDTINQYLTELPLETNSSPYQREFKGNKLLLQPIGAMGQTWAFLVMMYKQEPQEYDTLVLDSASLSIAQDLLRKRYIEERKIYTENIWVDDLLHNRMKDEEQMKLLLGSSYKELNETTYRVCLIDIENRNEAELCITEDGQDSIRFHFSLMLRSTFEQFAFRPFITMKNNRFMVIALDLPAKRSMRERIRQVFETLQKLCADERMGHFELRAGIGQAYSRLKNAHLSYQEALRALSLYSCYQKPFLFYEELGVFQLLLSMNDGKTLQSFIQNYLGPLIEHDRTKGSELLRTLKVYLDHDGSKQLAAQKLFIVRQSLYYRLEKIKELLGEDFMSPDKRLALQVALRAYQLLYPEQLRER
ncbi:PucR family transcriptional regulator [Collibacillus ludicampi]|uniref:PucR family transcriptional regulator n=1 Tax=Collibacillus ludicampi TaxID=2771369 RepID=A0AAV4LHP9_9BACL|nr:PucR family transcriptional regulator [Collibacillus ludicampi]GIM46947.1 PucR family transcriptional regulator [Collibacillus ludicampi]